MGDILAALVADGLVERNGDFVLYREADLRRAIRGQVLPALAHLEGVETAFMEDLLVDALCDGRLAGEAGDSGIGLDFKVGRFRFNAVTFTVFFNLLAGVISKDPSLSATLLQASSIALLFGVEGDSLKRGVVRALASQNREWSVDELRDVLVAKRFAEEELAELPKTLAELTREGMVKDVNEKYVAAEWWARVFGRYLDD